jgi:hypothetical protein
VVASTDSKPNRTTFTTRHLEKNPTATSKAVNTAWTEAGHSGQVSTTLVSKLRRELGLVGNVRGRPRAALNGSHGTPAAKSKGVKKGTKSNRQPSSTTSTGTKSSHSASRSRVLDGVDAGIDELVFTLKKLGGFADVEAALRTARRVLARSHGE